MQLSAHDRLEALRRCQIFANVPGDQLSVLASVVDVESFGPGELILEYGEESDGVYVIARGSCEVFLPDRTAPVATMTAGQLLGEYGLFGQRRRLATVRSVDELVLLYVENEHFKSFLHQFPAAMFAMFGVTVERLVAASRQPVASE